MDHGESSCRREMLGGGVAERERGGSARERARESEGARSGGVGEAARSSRSRSNRPSTVQSSVLRRRGDIAAGRSLGVVIRARHDNDDDRRPTIYMQWVIGQTRRGNETKRNATNRGIRANFRPRV